MSKDIPAISPCNPEELMTYGQYFETLFYKSKNKKKEGELTSDEAEFLVERKKLIDESNALDSSPIRVIDNVINFLIDNFLYSDFVNTLQAELDEVKNKEEFGILTKRVLNFIEKKMKENEQKNKKLFNSLMEQKTHCYNLRSKTIGWFPTKEMEMAIPEINSDDEDADEDYLPCTIEDEDEEEEEEEEEEDDEEDEDEIVVNFKVNASKKKGNEPYFEIKLHCDDDKCEEPYIVVDKIRKKQPNSGNKYIENSYSINVKIFLNEKNKKNFDFSSKKKLTSGVYLVKLLRKRINLGKLECLSKAKVMTKAEKGKFAVTKKGQTAQDFTYDTEGKLVSKEQKTGSDWAESVKEVSGLMKDPRNFTSTLVNSNLQQQFQNYYIVNCNYLERIANREPVNAEKVYEKLAIIKDVNDKLISMNIIPDNAATIKYQRVAQRQKEETKPLSKAPSAVSSSMGASSASKAPSAIKADSVVSKAHASSASSASKAPRVPSEPPKAPSVIKANSGASSVSRAPSAIGTNSGASSASSASRAPSAIKADSVVSKAHASVISKAPSTTATRVPSEASRAPSVVSKATAVSRAPTGTTIGTDVQSISHFKSSQKKFQSEYAKAPFAVSEYVDNWYAADSSIA